MKGQFESSETFEAYATIDAGYFMLNQIFSAIKANRGKPIDKELIRRSLIVLEDMIAAKKAIEADPSPEICFMARLHELSKPIRVNPTLN